VTLGHVRKFSIGFLLNLSRRETFEIGTGLDALPATQPKSVRALKEIHGADSTGPFFIRHWTGLLTEMALIALYWLSEASTHKHAYKCGSIWWNSFTLEMPR